MIVNIDGWFGGGKSVVWALLDGHSKVFVDPVHNYTFVPFLSDSFHPEWMSAKHSSKLRILLSRSEYYKYEKMMYDGTLPIHFKADHTLNLKYNINFYKLDRKYFSELMNLSTWSYESIIDTLYDCVDREWNSYSDVKPIKATMGKADAYMDYWNIPERFPNMKNILIKRNVYNIIATRSNRVARANDLSNDKIFNADFNLLISNGEVEKICHCFKTYSLLEEKYPNQFMTINFEDLILTPKESMVRICNFLEIEFEDVLLTPTRDGRILEEQGISFIGSEHDTAEKLLTNSEIRTIDRHIKQFELHQKPVNMASLKSLSLYLNSVAKKFFKRLLRVE